MTAGVRQRVARLRRGAGRSQQQELQSEELKAGALQHWQTHIAHNTSDDTGFAHDPNWSLINQF